MREECEGRIDHRTIKERRMKWEKGIRDGSIASDGEFGMCVCVFFFFFFVFCDVNQQENN